MKQSPHIVLETEETVVLREASRVSVGYCSGCAKNVLMASPQAAAFLARLTERHIFRMIEAESIHFKEDDCVLVCLDSVQAVVKETER